MSHATVLVITKDEHFDRESIDRSMYPFKELGWGGPDEGDDDPRAQFVVKVPADQVEKKALEWLEKKRATQRRRLAELEEISKLMADLHYEEVVKKFKTWFSSDDPPDAKSRAEQVADNYKKWVAAPGVTLYGNLIAVHDYEALFAKEGYEPDDDGNYGWKENPNAKWDWYSIGGRMAGMIKLKPGVIEDVVRTHRGELSPVAVAFGGQTRPKDGSVDSALVQDIAEDCLRDLVTFAVITEEGEWLEKAQLGWWGANCPTDRNLMPFPQRFPCKKLDDLLESDHWRDEYKERIGRLAYEHFEIDGGVYSLRKDVVISNEARQEPFFCGISWNQYYYKKFIEPLTPKHRLTVVDYHI